MSLADERIYYDDSYCTSFQGVVIAQTQSGKQWHVQLDRTAFYPTSGGQPHDTGMIDDEPVIDVVVQDGSVVHVLERALSLGQAVTGKVNWARRFDHMQQHCGQHILSRSFERLYDMETMGFHLGTESVTIDLRVDSLTWEEIEAAEHMANQVIWEDRIIHARFVAPEAIAGFDLRQPPKVNENIRIVSIDGFDDNACGGTHPKSTGQVGQIKVTRLERMHGGVRLTFACGARALADASRRAMTLRDLGATLSTGADELLDAVQKLQGSLQSARKREGALQTKVSAMLADQYFREATVNQKGVRIICADVLDAEPNDLKGLVQSIATKSGDTAFATACACRVNGRIHVQMAASPQAGFDVSQLLRAALARIGGKGGGTAVTAQGSVPDGESTSAASVLNMLRSELLP